MTSETVGTPAQPLLTHGQLTRLRARAPAEPVAVGDVLFTAGDPTYDFIFIESGEVDIIRPTTPDAPAEVVAQHGPGRFLGELNLLTGQAVYLTARVRTPGEVRRLTPAGFRQLMDEDGELSDVILRAFMARRELLLTGAGARSIEMLGSRLCAESNALRTWAARQRIPHVWMDIDDPEGKAFAEQIKAHNTDLPIVVTATGTTPRASAGVVAELLGLAYRPIEGAVFDVVVVGGGPAGLAAAVYGASEGLSTMLLDATAVGGQAAASSRIENYLGFPYGLSGEDLMGLGLVQAQKFGAHVATPCRAVAMHTDGDQLRLTLSDGTDVPTRSVVIATGASYRKLALTGWERLEGAGIYYAATDLEVRECAAQPVCVVGGANSAGQAAIYLAEHGSPVTLVLRGPTLDKGMSHYLVDRIRSEPSITVRPNTEVVGVSGSPALESITLNDRMATSSEDIPCRGLFCFIGAEPATTWLDAPALDADGFVLTDEQLDDALLGSTWSLLGRRPLPFETSVPGVFAVGDVRHASMKRVAAAVGEGASAIRSVHTSIGALA